MVFEITSIIKIIGLLLLSIVFGYFFNYIKILKIKYLFNKDDGSDDATHKHLLKDVISDYGPLFRIITPIAISWAIFGILLTIVISNPEFEFVNTIQTYEVTLIIWILISAIILGLIPFLIATDKVDIPYSLENMIQSRFTHLLLLYVISGLLFSIFYLKLPTIDILLVLLISIPAFISAWFAGNFYTVFSIRQYYKAKGWDYIEGVSLKHNITGYLQRVSGLTGFILAMLAPVLALNSIISIFLPIRIQENGGLIGQYFDDFLPPVIQLILVFALILGPLISIAIQPANFLEITINSEIYYILSNLDWDDFYSRTDKTRQEISLKPYNRKEMAGIIIVFISFLLYFVILTIGGILRAEHITLGVGFNDIPMALKFIEIPIFLTVVIKASWNFEEERDVLNIARLGYKENRDITGWSLWILQNLFDKKYNLIKKNLQKYLKDPISAGNPKLYFYMGLVHSFQFNFADAESNFRKAIELDSKFADAWMELGIVVYYQHRYNEALIYLLRAMELKSQSKVIMYNIGRVYDVLKREEEAVYIYKKALEFDKNDAKIWASLGKVLIEIGDFDEGIKATKKALNLNPEDYIAKLNLTVALMKAGDIEKYQEYIDDLLRKHPDSSRIKKSIEITQEYSNNSLISSLDLEYNLASCFDIKGDAEYARKRYKAALDIAVDKSDKYMIEKINRKLSGL